MEKIIPPHDSPSIFTSYPMDGGYTWTITTRLGDILKSIEEKYGEREQSYTILGVEYTQESQPGHWFPGNCKQIAIQITNNCQNNMCSAIYEVAHEAVHCLYPKQIGQSTYLEEGIATYFAKEYVQNQCEYDMPINGVKYQQAYDLTALLLNEDASIIKRMREEEPNLSAITKEMILKYKSNLPAEIASKLATNFQITIEN